MLAPSSGIEPSRCLKQQETSAPGLAEPNYLPYLRHTGARRHTGVSGGHIASRDSAHEIASRVYALGFEHKWAPKYPDQLERSINSLASPSQHPDKFERVAPRVLKLR